MAAAVARPPTRPAQRRLPGRPIALTAPFLFNSFAVYPEIAGALAVVLAFTLDATGTGHVGDCALARVGLACAALPWLSTKYAPMSAALSSSPSRAWLAGAQR